MDARLIDKCRRLVQIVETVDVDSLPRSAQRELIKATSFVETLADIDAEMEGDELIENRFWEALGIAKGIAIASGVSVKSFNDPLDTEIETNQSRRKGF